MAITVRKATPEDAPLLAQTRRIVWEQTYRGIYPDEMLDGYNMEYHINRDRGYLLSPDQHYYLFLSDNRCVGYTSFGPCNYGKYRDFDLCLNSLYIIQGFKGMGLGKQAFARIREYAREKGIVKFFCGCNIHNLPAQAFYRHMGGTVGLVCGGHENRSEDIIHFEFHIGEEQ